MKDSITIGAILVGFMSWSTQAATLNYEDFSSTDGLSVNATAATVADNGFDPDPVLRLAATNANFRSGSAFTLEEIGILRFSTQFAFRVTPNFPNFPTDGFTFAMQTVRPTNVGLTGGNLGFQGMGIPSGGANVGVEFDTFQNGQDTSNNHIGVDVNTTTSVQSVVISPRFSNGNLWFAWIDYDGSTLEVRTNDTGTRPDEPDMAHSINLPEVVGEIFSHVGFTASTGGDRTAFEIISWKHSWVRPGDANLDDRVTFADFAILQNHFNEPGGLEEGDFNNDGQVTLADFSILQNNFEGDAGSAAEMVQAMSQFIVPEPATLSLIAMILAGSAIRPRKSQSHAR